MPAYACRHRQPARAPARSPAASSRVGGVRPPPRRAAPEHDTRHGVPRAAGRPGRHCRRGPARRRSPTAPAPARWKLVARPRSASPPPPPRASASSHVAGGEPRARERAVARQQQVLRGPVQARAVGLALLAGRDRLGGPAELAQQPRHRFRRRRASAPGGAGRGRPARRARARPARAGRQTETARAPGPGRIQQVREPAGELGVGEPRERGEGLVARRPGRGVAVPEGGDRGAGSATTRRAPDPRPPPASTSASLAWPRQPRSRSRSARAGRAEIQADPVGGQLGQEVAGRDVPAPPRLLLGAEPRLDVAIRTVTRRAPAGRASQRASRAELARARAVACRALRLRQRGLDRRPPLAGRRALGCHPQRRRVEARRRRRRGPWSSRAAPPAGRSHLVAAQRGVLDVMGAGDRTGAAPLERRHGASMGGQPPAAQDAIVDRVRGGPGCRTRTPGGARGPPSARASSSSSARSWSSDTSAASAASAARTGRRPPPRPRAPGATRRTAPPARRSAPARPTPAPRRPARAVRGRTGTAAERVGRGRVGADELGRLGLAERHERQVGHAAPTHRARQRGGEGLRPAAFAGDDGEQHRAAGRPPHGARRARRSTRRRPAARRRVQRTSGRAPARQSRRSRSAQCARWR